MRFISMHKTNESNEASQPLSPTFIAEMGKLMQRMQEAGALLAGEGLRASSLGVRLTFVGGHRTITPGPFVGSNELLAGFVMVRVRDLDEAIEWATRYAGVVGDAELDIRPVTEAWDLGMCPRPEGLETTRFLIGHKADKNSEAGVPASPAVVAALAALKADMAKAGVLLASEALKPSSLGVRLKFAGPTRTVIDGPFTESKELIAGFVIVEAQSIDEVIAWNTPFAHLIGDVEIDVRLLQDS